MPWLVRFNQTYRLQDRLNVTAWILTKSVTKGKNIRRGDKVFLATYAVILGSGVILCDPILADEAREELQFFTTQQAQQEFDQPLERVFIDIRDRYRNPVPVVSAMTQAGIPNLDARHSFVELTDQQFATADTYIRGQQP